MPKVTLHLDDDLYDRYRSANLPRGRLSGLFRQALRAELDPEHQSPLEIADQISWLSKRLVYHLRETQ